MNEPLIAPLGGTNRVSPLTRHCEIRAIVPAPVDRVFAHIDDHARLSSHMSESSWMMGGGRMQIEYDEGRGQKVGSRIRLSGRVFGFELSVEEIVTEREPPLRKIWQTTGSPKLLVIGHYRMGFDLSPRDKVQRFGFISSMRCRRAESPAGSGVCSARAMRDGARSAWWRMR